MFIGARYKLNEDKGSKSMFGYKTIEIMERVLFRTRITTTKEDGKVVKIECPEYLIYCMVDGNSDTAEIQEDEFGEEIMAGIYDYTGVYKH